MEKIFQIQFSLKPMTSQGYESLVASLLGGRQTNITIDSSRNKFDGPAQQPDNKALIELTANNVTTGTDKQMKDDLKIDSSVEIVKDAKKGPKLTEQFIINEESLLV